MTRFRWSTAGRPHNRRWRQLRFADVLLVSVVPLTVVAALVVGAVGDYARALGFQDWWTAGQSVSTAFEARAGWLARFPAALALDRSFDSEDTDPAVLRLGVDRADWDTVLAQPRRGFGEWADATITVAGRLEPARVRKRGDTSVHWTTPKISFTLRTPRGRLYRGYRSLGFSGKDVLTAYVASQMAHAFELLAPNTWITPVFLNARFYGVFRQTELADEGFLRRHGLMPGNIFRGDAAERGEYFKGVPRSLFANPAIWELSSVNDRPTGPGQGQLEAWLRDLQNPTEDGYRRFRDRIDPDELARLSALLLLLGDPYHMDDVHNQLWFEDPATARMRPIPWDLRIRDLMTPSDAPVNTVLRTAWRDPMIVDRIMGILVPWLEGEQFVATADSVASATVNRFGPYFQFEYLRHAIVPPVGTVDEVHGHLAANSTVLRDWLGDARARVGGGGAAEVGVLDIEVGGYAPLEVSAFLQARGARPSIWRDSNRDGVFDPGDRRVVVVWEQGPDSALGRPAEPEVLATGWDARHQPARPIPTHYRYFVVGGGGRPGSVALRNRHTGEAVSAEPWPEGHPIAGSAVWHPWQHPHRTARAHRWAGEVLLERTLELPPGDSLLLAPGTRVRLGPDVSLVVRGPMMALGTAAQPVRFDRLDPTRPWGAVALQGPAASGSRLDHTAFVGGGGSLVGGVEYIGMVNVHSARDVVLHGCRFERNVRSDDTFHALHAEVTIRESDFVDANSDAIDFDYSTGELRANRFHASGGDGIDLMSSHPLVVGNVIDGSGDKGVSVGEGSHPQILNNTILGGSIGIEVKDASEPVLVGNVIRGNTVGLKLSVKNWRYGSGGWPKLNGNTIEANGVAVERDAFSRVSQAAWMPAQPRGVVAQPWLPALRSAPTTAWLLAGMSPGWTRMMDQVFDDGFTQLDPQWAPKGGVRRLLQRDQSFQAILRSDPGEVGRVVDWEVPPGDTGLMVVEMATHHLSRLRLTLESDAGARTVELPIEADSSAFTLLGVPLPSGRYRRIAFKAVPAATERRQRSTGLVVLGSAQIRLRRLAAFRPSHPKELAP